MDFLGGNLVAYQRMKVTRLGLAIAGLATTALTTPAVAQRYQHTDYPPLFIRGISDDPEAPNYLNPQVPPEGFNYIAEDPEIFSTRDPMEFYDQIPPAKNKGRAWKIYKTEWDDDDEKGFRAFITGIGRTRCSSLDACLRHEANPYRDLEDDHIYFGDCADMAYFMRGYYAWKNGLPWSYQSSMRTADGSRDDPRYSKAGNVVASRRSIVTPRGGNPVDAPSLLKSIGGQVSTAMFRTHPETGAPGTFDDFYPVDIDRAHVVPGAIAYDVFGHVGLVYEVEEDGRVMIIASHPDFSVTRSVYGANFMRTGPDFGGGLKAWRPIQLVGATKKDDGTYIGGRVVGAKNKDLPGYSVVQYFGNVPSEDGDWTLGEFHLGGRTLEYYEFVRRKLAAPGYAFDPIREMRNAMGSICGDLKARKAAVDQGVRAGIHEQAHPGILPPNIYGTYGTWEAYSTPSRDARLKTAFLELRRMTEELVSKHMNGEPGVDYDGDNLPGDLLNAFDDEKLKCQITYTRMDNSVVKLNISHVMDRLFDMSFDPYHCPERRWGATGYELSTCKETANKRAWYEAEQYLRNQVSRTYDVKMNFRLDQLKPPAEATPEAGGIGQQEAPDIHIKKYLLGVAKPHSSEEGTLGKEFAKTRAVPVNGDSGE